MSRPSDWLYLWVFLSALGAGLVLTPIARHFGMVMGVVDEPGGHKRHLEPVSVLGGLAIYAGTFVAAWALVSGARAELKGLFLAGLVILVFGLQDDISPMNPWLKLLAQVTAALVLVGFGVQVSLTDIGWLDVLLTVVWVVGVVNAVNFQDNMNGLAAGLAAVSSLGFLALAIVAEQWLVAILSAGLAGGALGFLGSNYPRARIFMGDAGSMFLGFVLAFLGIRLQFLDEPQSTAFLLPALVLGVPLFDAATVTVSRIRRRLPVGKGGDDHASHELVSLGLNPPAAVAALWGIQALLCAAAFAVAKLETDADITILSVIGAFGLGTGYVFVFR